MYVEHQQCIVLNLSREKIPASQVRHLLAPLCRDYFLYAGISSPVRSIEELKFAFLQAELALEKAFYLHNERWAVPFSACVLDYLLKHIPPELPPGYLAAPELPAHNQYQSERPGGTALSASFAPSAGVGRRIFLNVFQRFFDSECLLMENRFQILLSVISNPHAES